MNTYDKAKIQLFAGQIRYQIIRQISKLGFGHIGGSMSIADILAVLYGRHINSTPSETGKIDRDIFILSKGHAGPALYATLALKGFLPLNELDTLNQPPTRLPSHCDRNLTPGIDMTTGSLGQGLGVAAGVALGAKIKGYNSRTFCIIGDGECDEGQIWEAVLFAAGNCLDRLIVFLDRNRMQNDGETENICPLGDMGEKFNAFGWYIQEIDGHNIEEIDNALLLAEKNNGKPSLIIANTIKGMGCRAAFEVEMNHMMSLAGESGKRELNYQRENLAKLEKVLEAAK